MEASARVRCLVSPSSNRVSTYISTTMDSLLHVKVRYRREYLKQLVKMKTRESQAIMSRDWTAHIWSQSHIADRYLLVMSNATLIGHYCPAAERVHAICTLTYLHKPYLMLSLSQRHPCVIMWRDNSSKGLCITPVRGLDGRQCLDCEMLQVGEL